MTSDKNRPVAGATTVGPLETEVRDELADYRDREGFSSYNEALRSLLKKAERGDDE